jgi:hypothetical protein
MKPHEVRVRAEDAVNLARETLEMVCILAYESERGCVLVASAYIEDSLRELLLAKCRTMSTASEDELSKTFKSFDSQFYNFSSCIRLAHAMGLLRGELARALLDFSPWRNQFAHRPGAPRLKERQVKRLLTPFEGEMAYLLSTEAVDELGQLEWPQKAFLFWAGLVDREIRHLTISLQEST